MHLDNNTITSISVTSGNTCMQVELICNCDNIVLWLCVTSTFAKIPGLIYYSMLLLQLVFK